MEPPISVPIVTMASTGTASSVTTVLLTARAVKISKTRRQMTVLNVSKGSSETRFLEPVSLCLKGV